MIEDQKKNRDERKEKEGAARVMRDITSFIYEQCKCKCLGFVGVCIFIKHQNYVVLIKYYVVL